MAGFDKEQFSSFTDWGSLVERASLTMVCSHQDTFIDHLQSSEEPLKGGGVGCQPKYQSDRR